MRLIFWVSTALLIYTYIGYLGWLKLRSTWKAQPIRQAPICPRVSILIAVKNEEATIASKIENVLQLDYPAELMDVVIVSDGSTDGTNQILKQYEGRIRSVISTEGAGKAAALNAGLEVISSEVVTFTDARQQFEPGALRRLLTNFADPKVGCVSGELMLRSAATSQTAQALGFYWTLEKKIRRLESETGSVVGATGAIYAVRRNLVKTIPAGTILDDVMIPMRVVGQGFRTVFEPTALAWDTLSTAHSHEFRRKVRTLLGNYQLIRSEPWLLTPKNPLLFEFVSHKLMRLAGPFLLLLVLLSSALSRGIVYKTAFWLQVLVYVMAALALFHPHLPVFKKVTNSAFTFVSLNVAALYAFFYFIRGKKGVWVR